MRILLGLQYMKQKWLYRWQECDVELGNNNSCLSSIGEELVAIVASSIHKYIRSFQNIYGYLYHGAWADEKYHHSIYQPYTLARLWCLHTP